MKKSITNLIRLAARFEQKLSLAVDNPKSDEILKLQKAITALLGRDEKIKSRVDEQLKNMVNIGTSSGGGKPWTPGPKPEDEDSYLGERTKRAVYVISKVSGGAIPNVTEAPLHEIADAINNYNPNASFAPV